MASCVVCHKDRDRGFVAWLQRTLFAKWWKCQECRRHYCPACFASLEIKTEGRARICRECGADIWLPEIFIGPM